MMDVIKHIVTKSKSKKNSSNMRQKNQKAKKGIANEKNARTDKAKRNEKKNAELRVESIDTCCIKKTMSAGAKRGRGAMAAARRFTE